MTLPNDGPIIRTNVPPASTIYVRRPEQIRAWWNAIYHNRQTQLGATATLVNFGDANNFGALDAATGTGAQFSATGLAPTWTPTSALSGWATPFNLAGSGNWQGVIPVLTFNGTSEYLTTPDATYWTRLESGAAKATWGMWINIPGAAGITSLMTKYDGIAGQAEWAWEINADETIRLILVDEVDDITINRTTDAALSVDTWHQVIVTYDGGTSALTAAANDITYYVDGVSVASTATNDALYSGMANGTEVVAIGVGQPSGTPNRYFNGRMAGGPCGPFFVQAALTVAQVLNMYRIERLALGV